MPRNIVRPQQISTAVALTGFSAQMAVWGAGKLAFMIRGVGFTGSVKIRNSIKLGVDLTAAESASVPFDYIAMRQQQAAGVVVAGDTGAAFTTFTGTEVWECNAEVFGEAIAEITRSAGTVSIWVIGIGLD